MTGDWNALAARAEWIAFAARAARSTLDWFEDARNLRYVADRLWPPVGQFFEKADAYVAEHGGSPSPELMLEARGALRFTGPYVLLAGLAIENVAKGLVVQREDPVQGDRLAGWFMTHDVHALLVRASIPLSDNETHTCAVLRAYVEWAGKYPVSSRLSASGPQETAAGGFIPTAGWFRPENKVAVDALFEKEPHRPAARNPSRRPA